MPCGCETCRCGAVRLGELERQVMELLWDRQDEEITGRAVADALPGSAYTTLVTVLDRLSRKGMVRRTLIGRINFYRATMTRSAFAAGAMLDLLHTTSARDDTLRLFVRGLGSGEARTVASTLTEGPPRAAR